MPGVPHTLHLPLQLFPHSKAFPSGGASTVAFLPDCHGQLKRRAMGTREPRLVWLAKTNQAVWRAVGSVLPEPEPVLSLETEVSQNHGWERVQMAGKGTEGRKPEVVQSPPFRKYK